MAKISDFSKQHIWECYNVIFDYLKNFEPVDEDEEDSEFMFMMDEIEKRSVCIPEDIYNKIDEFVTDNIIPLSSGEAFDDMQDAIDEGSDDQEITAKYMWAIMQRQNALREFAKKELYPLLIS